MPSGGNGKSAGRPHGTTRRSPASLPLSLRECVAQHLLALCAGFGLADHFVHIGASILRHPGGSALGPGGAARDTVRGAEGKRGGRTGLPERDGGPSPPGHPACQPPSQGSSSIAQPRRGEGCLASPTERASAPEPSDGNGKSAGRPHGATRRSPASLPLSWRECVAQHRLPLCAGFGSADHFVHIGASILRHPGGSALGPGGAARDTVRGAGGKARRTDRERASRLPQASVAA